MDLTSEEVNDKQFHDAWRGYNQGEVDDFLDRVAETIDRLQRENADLTKRVAELDQAVAASRETEEMLKKTLVTAQQAAEEAIAKARAQAEELINEAEVRVQASESQARERVDQAEAEARRRAADTERDLATKRRESEERIAGLRATESNVKQRLRAFLEQQLRALETLGANDAPPLTRSGAVPRTTEGKAEPQAPPRGAGPGGKAGDVGHPRPEPAEPAAAANAGDSGAEAEPSAGGDEVASRQPGLRDFLRKKG